MVTEDDDDDDDYVALAEVARPHGVSGDLKVRVYNPESDLLTRTADLCLVASDGVRRAVRLRRVRELPGGDLLVRLDGVEDREGAEAMRGARFEVSRRAFAPIVGAAAEDEFYVVDLQGCTAYLDDAPVGTVVEVLGYPTCDVLVIDRDGDRKHRLEVPFLESYVGPVDLATRRVRLLTLDGLT
ncbi:MAG: ribosome maturation factor RimM [Myxococcota bacterium]